MGRITMKDIAEKAGISRKYVSGILNGSKEIWVSDETRQRVLDLVKELNYVPNHFARSLKTGKTEAIGVTSGTGIAIKTMFADPYFAHLFGGIGEVASQRGYRMLFQQNKEVLSEETSIEMARNNPVDGIIFILLSEFLDDFHTKQLPRLRDLGIPFSVIMGVKRPYDAPVASADPQQGAYIATTHLLEHGYRDISFMGYLNDNPFDNALKDGFTHALAVAGITRDDSRLIDAGGIHQWDGKEWVEQTLAAGGSIPRALFIGRSELAQGVQMGLTAAGIKVPEECALVAYGLIDRVNEKMSTITTVHQPVFETGKAATELLFERMEGKKVQSRVLEGTLEVRTSCGCG